MTKIGLASVLSLALLVAFGIKPSISRADGGSIKLEASLSGTFTPDGQGIPGTLFIVRTTGESTDSDLGPFQFNAFAVQDQSIAVHECDTPGSSTGVVGSAEMILDDESEVWLTLRSNEACLNTSFTGIDLVEKYVITGGTGLFEGCKGKVRLELIGRFPGPPPFPFDATMTGKIKLKDESENQ